MKKIFLLFLALFICLSCKTVLTTSLRAKIIADKIPIDKVQFYNTKKIILFREVSANKGETEHGKVKFINGKYYEFIKFRKNTPCICSADSNKNLSVSFEQNYTLKFGNEMHRFFLMSDNQYYSAPHSGVYHGFPYYQIYADSWSLGQHFNSSYSDIRDVYVGQVTYADSTYLIIKGKNARLSLKKEQLNKLDSKSRTVKGLKVE